MLTALMGRIDINGVRLFTREVGAGPLTIVLHGGPGAHLDYLLPQYDRLATNRRLGYYDQRGGGQSPVDREVPVGWREQVADLEALCARWRSQPATLLGYSWGGLLAMLYATEHPASVERLALVCPAPITKRHREEFERTFAARMADPALKQARRELQASGLRDRDPGQYRKRAFELSVWGYFRDPAQAVDLTPFRVTERTRQAVWDSLADYDLTEALRSLSIPSLVVHGRHDPIPLQSGQAIAELLGGKLVVLDAAGHAPHVEATSELMQVLDEFLPGV